MSPDRCRRPDSGHWSATAVAGPCYERCWAALCRQCCGAPALLAGGDGLASISHGLAQGWFVLGGQQLARVAQQGAAGLHRALELGVRRGELVPGLDELRFALGQARESFLEAACERISL